MTTDPRVDRYIERAAPFARPILRHLRETLHTHCPDLSETIKWSRPMFLYNKRIFCGMAAFTAHCSFGFWHPQMAAIIGELRDGAGQFGRIARVADLPDEPTLRHYIVEAVRLEESEEPSRRTPVGKSATRRPALPVPDDFARLLKRNPKAAHFFASLSPSGKREYLAWIADAKREPTRLKRLATSIEWLAEGKQRDWKYQKC